VLRTDEMLNYSPNGFLSLGMMQRRTVQQKKMCVRISLFFMIAEQRHERLRDA
jgi:hypothetical protein